MATATLDAPNALTEHTSQPGYMPPVDRPRDAWLGPIGGFILALIIGAILGGTTQPVDGPTYEVIAYIPPAIFLMFAGYGIVKTARCFQAARHPIHGVLGVLAAGASLAWIGLIAASLLELF